MLQDSTLPARESCLYRLGASLASNLGELGLQACSQDRDQERKTGSCHTYVGACGLYSCPPPSRARNKVPVQSRNARDVGLRVTPSKSPTPDTPVSQKCIKCWCMRTLWGRPKRSRAPPLDQGSRRRDSALKGQGLALGTQSARREGRPTTTTLGGLVGLGKLRCSPGLEGTEKGAFDKEPEEGGPRRWTAAPLGREGGDRGGLGGLRGWDNPSGAYSCEPGGPPEWPSRIPPSPPPWSWLSTRGSQRH